MKYNKANTKNYYYFVLFNYESAFLVKLLQ